MAESLVTQVSRDGTPAKAPTAGAGGAPGAAPAADSAPKRKGLGGLFAACFGSKKAATAAVVAAANSQQAAGGGKKSAAATVPDDGAEYLLPPLKADSSEKMCLVLDLDETLVHSSFKPVPNADFIVPVEIEGTVHQVYVAKRPHVDEFLERLCPQFEVVIFTASLSKYATPVMDLLDRTKGCQYHLFRESCSLSMGAYVKDLARLGRDLSRTIIIDNSPTSYLFHPENAVPIGSWFDDPQDTELLDLIPFLEALTKVEDVRTVLETQETA